MIIATSKAQTLRSFQRHKLVGSSLLASGRSRCASNLNVPAQASLWPKRTLRQRPLSCSARRRRSSMVSCTAALRLSIQI